MSGEPEADLDASGGPKKTSPPLTPRDAASLLILDRSSNVPRVLMGRRRDDQVFMPGKYVFPGGRMDLVDRTIVPADDLAPRSLALLQVSVKSKSTLALARALALAAVRETFEETGLVMGAKHPAGQDAGQDAGAIPALKKSAQAQAKPAADTWAAFGALGFKPCLSALTFIARATTPPNRPRRYDTRFFYADASALAEEKGPPDGELSGLHWLTLAEARELDLPSITRVVLQDLEDSLAPGGGIKPDHPVPYYHMSRGLFRRDLLEIVG